MKNTKCKNIILYQFYKKPLYIIIIYIYIYHIYKTLTYSGLSIDSAQENSNISWKISFLKVNFFDFNNN